MEFAMATIYIRKLRHMRHSTEVQPMENYYLPGELKMRIEEFIIYYNTRRYHESINNLTPEDVFLDRGNTILEERQKIKLKTMKKRKALHRKAMAA